ncbi:MAG: hypothetical protein ACOY40_15200 [Bacillota bacterium]
MLKFSATVPAATQALPDDGVEKLISRLVFKLAMDLLKLFKYKIFR